MVFSDVYYVQTPYAGQCRKRSLLSSGMQVSESALLTLMVGENWKELTNGLLTGTIFKGQIYSTAKPSRRRKDAETKFTVVI